MVFRDFEDYKEAPTNVGWRDYLARRQQASEFQQEMGLKGRQQATSEAGERSMAGLREAEAERQHADIPEIGARTGLLRHQVEEGERAEAGEVQQAQDLGLTVAQLRAKNAAREFALNTGLKEAQAEYYSGRGEAARMTAEGRAAELKALSRKYGAQADDLLDPVKRQAIVDKLAAQGRLMDAKRIEDLSKASLQDRTDPNLQRSPAPGSPNATLEGARALSLEQKVRHEVAKHLTSAAPLDNDGNPSRIYNDSDPEVDHALQVMKDRLNPNPQSAAATARVTPAGPPRAKPATPAGPPSLPSGTGLPAPSTPPSPAGGVQTPVNPGPAASPSPQKVLPRKGIDQRNNKPVFSDGQNFYYDENGTQPVPSQ